MRYLVSRLRNIASIQCTKLLLRYPMLNFISLHKLKQLAPSNQRQHQQISVSSSPRQTLCLLSHSCLRPQQNIYRGHSSVQMARFHRGPGFGWLCRIPVFPRFCTMTFAYGKGNLQKSFYLRGELYNTVNP